MFVYRPIWQRIRLAALVGVLFLYAMAVCAVDLFHNERCISGDNDAADACVLYSNAPCPACSFSAASNSTEAHYETSLTCLQLTCQPAPLVKSTILAHSEWACSISLRAPPSADLY